jgi:lipopolysaccharide transport system permease protein
MSETITVIQPSNKWKLLDLKEIWNYRELLYAFVKRDVTAKYRQTFVGAGWAIIQPFMTMVIFSFFFGKLAKMPSDGVPYPIFSYAGLLLWTYFSNALSGAANSMVGASGLITKVYFPRIIVPLATTLQFMIDYFVATIILFVMMFIYHVPLTIGLLGLPFIVFFTWLLAAGSGFILTAINVRYRDVQYIVPFFISLLMYVTPVIYPASVADRFRFILAINPMTGLIETHRALILSQPIPWNELGLSIVYTLIIFIVGSLYFKKVERGFADVI